MPKLYLPVPEVDKSMTRPVVLDIIRQVKDITGIPKETKELFLGSARTGLQEGSTAGADITNNTKILSSAQLAIEVAETYNEAYFGTVAINQVEQPVCFLDDELGVVLKPIYTTRQFEVSVQYRNPSRTKAMQWRDDIFMHVNQMRDVNLHSAKYHYQIPNSFFALLKEIHTLRENVAGYGQDFDQYLRTHLTPRATTITTLNGDKAALAITEEQMRIQGMFDFSEAPQKEQMGGEANVWMSEFTYKFSLDVPTGMAVHYPAIVHNQLIDEKFIPEPTEDDKKHIKIFAHSLKSLNYFEVPYTMDRYAKPNEYRHYPEYDDWYPDNHPPEMRMLYSALCQVDTSTPKLICNLKDLGEYVIDEEILKWLMQGEYKYLTKPYKSILHLTYYRNSHLTNYKHSSVNANLDYAYNEDLSLRDIHRMCISIVEDIHSLDIEFLRRLKRNPSVMRKLLKTINISYSELAILSPRIDLTPYFPELDPGGITKDIVFDAWKMQPYTVQTALIEPKQRKDID